MDTVTATVELPRDLLNALRIAPDELDRRVREWTALELYREELISAGKAAEILGLTKSRFIDLLSERGIDYLDLTQEELAADVAAADAAALQRRE
jgi:predicted HTH domain antitoxin